MFRFRRFFWTLLAILVLAYAGAHALIRTAWLQSVVERGLSERFGYAVKAEKIRFSSCFGLLLTNVKLTDANAAADAQPVFEAPFARYFRCRRATFVKATSPVLRAMQRADGSWSPAVALSATSGVGPEEFFNKVAASAGRIFFDFTDATVQVSGFDGSSVTYCGVNWYRSPIHVRAHGTLEGRCSSVACVCFARVQCLVEKSASGETSTKLGENGEFAILREWLEIDGETFFLKGKPSECANDSAPSVAPAEASEPAPAVTQEPVKEAEPETPAELEAKPEAPAPEPAPETPEEPALEAPAEPAPAND